MWEDFYDGQGLSIDAWIAELERMVEQAHDRR